MSLDIAKTRKLLGAFEFKALFIEELGWNRHDARLEVPIDGQAFTLAAVAEKCGMAAFVCGPGATGRIPDYPTRRKIERQVARRTHEHLLIYTDGKRTTQLWQWVRRAPGKPAACREHAYHAGQPGDSLIQKLQALAVSLEEEESLTLPDVTGRARRAFDVERVTKKFYDRFRTEHAAFLKFLQGIPDEGLERWYVSVMLNRLMFIYFIQKKGFLNDDRDYLKNKLTQCRKQLGRDRFYRDLLCPLIFEGFAKRNEDRSGHARKLLGEVPYLNGGIFMPHQIEQLHGKAITIPDKAFEKLFEFFDDYQWHLDERPLRKDDEINPDVLGYIFEKYINQKQMGAYYTREDITGYISQNTVVPFLFDAAREKCKVAFEGGRSVWRLLREEPDRCIYPAVKHGVDLPLPPEIAVGVNDVSKRNGWNRPAPGEYALPSEIWREVVARRKRYEEVRRKLVAGEVRPINDFITCNLDIRQFAQDVIENSEGPELLVAFWKAIENVTVLDPTCGSGAFLFAALNILEPLYEACLERMRFFVEEWGDAGKKNHPNYHKLFTETLKRVEDHPSHRYFVLKSAIVNNLYGVDIMEEAVEICKLRLFLKLVAQIERVEDIEPLPDIDFNIRAGNTLVGFTSLDRVRKTQEGTLGFGKSEVARIEEEAEVADRAFRRFRHMQTEQGMKPADFAEAKENLRSRLKQLTDELDRFLAGEYGVDAKKRDTFDKWRKSHHPFHWFAEFYGILKAGGFDVIIGNPPYLEYSKVMDYKVRNYVTEDCANLYVFTVERSFALCSPEGRVGMIIPISVACSGAMEPLRNHLSRTARSLWLSHFSNRPGQLFTGAQNRLTILVASGQQKEPNQFSTRYYRWDATNGERDNLFPTLRYQTLGEDASIFHGLLPKVGSPEAANLLAKIRSSRTVELFTSRQGRHKTFWVRVPGYFCQFLLGPPMARAEGGGPPRVRGEVNHIGFDDKLNCHVAHAVLNSSTYYQFFCSYTDTRHINPSDVTEFPLDLTTFSNGTKEKLAELSMKLAKCCAENTSQRRKSGLLIDSIDSKRCKPILDEIDNVLARHYGFTDEELDFIINYDIKYRVGQDSDGPEGE